MKVQDLVGSVKNKLAGVTNVEPFIIEGIRDAVMDMTTSYPFDELQLDGPVTAFTNGQAKYPVINFLNEGDTYTRIISWYVNFTSFSTPVGSNGPSTGYCLKWRNPNVVKPMTFIPGVPVYFTRVGKFFYIGMLPNQAYPMEFTYQKKHPFSDYANSIMTTNQQPSILGDEILMPDDWREIVVVAAAEKAAICKRALDFAAYFHKMLYGDPKHPGELGIIAQRLSQTQRDSMNNERSMQPNVATFSGM